MGMGKHVNIIRTSGTILSAIFTIVPYILSVSGIATVFGYDIKLHWFTLGGFFAFLIFIGWIILDFRKIIHDLSYNLPSIQTKFSHDPTHGVYIDVKNNGATAEFKAQVEVLNSDDLDPQIEVLSNWRRFPGYWEGKSTESIPIMKGESQRIRLVSFEQSTDAKTGWLRMYKMNGAPAIDNMLSVDTFTFPILASRGRMVPGLHLKVTITSDPSPKEDIVILEFKIKANGDVHRLV